MRWPHPPLYPILYTRHRIPNDFFRKIKWTNFQKSFLLEQVCHINNYDHDDRHHWNPAEIPSPLVAADTKQQFMLTYCIAHGNTLHSLHTLHKLHTLHSTLHTLHSPTHCTHNTPLKTATHCTHYTQNTAHYTLEDCNTAQFSCSAKYTGTSQQNTT